jgi:cyclophilin family peptidyl-prolyl cis-trans isomerase
MSTPVIVLLSVLFPLKGWFAPTQPWNVSVKPPAGVAVTLVATDFAGAALDAAQDVQRDVDRETTVDVKEIYPAVAAPGTYVIYAVPRGQVGFANFEGTPLVLTVREDRRRGAPAGAMAAKIEPLRYAVLSTDAGDMTVAFYYNSAPNTISNFITLANEGFYDGLTFHRAEPDFIVQGGDPRGDGTGGPGYNLDAEFSDRKHSLGTVSMSRNVDPNESPNNPPRPEYANSAGSQFFISVDATEEHKNTAQLDGVYTVFGRVLGADSLHTLDAIAHTPILDKRSARPARPPVIKTIQIRPVTRRENPYAVLQAPEKSTAASPKTTPEQRTEAK